VVNIVPTAAFGREIGDYLSPGEDRSFEVIPFGIHHVTFANSTPAGRARVEARLSTRPGVQRILLVSHYNYFRNFDTLLAAVALLKRRYARPVELVLTTRLAEGHWEHRYDTSASARRLGSLGLSEDVTMLGPVPHDELADLYALADVVVCPSYAESFGHPMVEAMASGRPVVASKRGVHREICGEAAVYFSTFDADDLAGRLADLLSQPAMADELGRLGRERSRAFSWPEHFGRLIEVVQTTLAEKQNARVSV
jgi:glycosyltransferase involved in cell wall biosynthesis